MGVEHLKLPGPRPEIFKELALHIGKLAAMDLDSEGFATRVAVEAEDVVVDQDLELERFAAGGEMAHLPILLDHLGDVGPILTLGGIGKSADVDLVFDKSLPELLGLSVIEKRV